MKKIIFFLITSIILILSGCAHNIHVRGVGLATPYGAFGYGDFSCVKDNVEIESSEKAELDGKAETKHKLSIGRQTNGYDIELEAVRAKKTQ